MNLITPVVLVAVFDRLAIGAAAFLVAVWVVYPAAIAAMAAVAVRLRRGRSGPESSPELPTVSVVIATRESDDVVTERIRNCLDTAYPRERLEVVIARDSAHAGSLTSLPSNVLEVTADPPGGKASALNAGVRTATGEIVVFADSHQRFLPDTIPLLVARLGQNRVGVVSGRLELPLSSLAARYWSYERWLRRMEARVHSSIGATGAVYAIRRSLWQPLRPGLLLDDVYTPMRIVLAGWRVSFAENAVAIETRTHSPRQEYVRKVRTLTGVVQLCAWLPAVLLPIRNPVWIQFVFHKLLRMLTPYALAIIALWAVFEAMRLAGPAAPLIGLVGVVLGLWIAFTRAAAAQRFRAIAVEGILLQWAVVLAGINGLRGRWGVWDA